MIPTLSKLKKILFTTLVFFVTLPSFASHYQGGNITYEFLGIFGGQYRYRFQLDVYVNCLSSSLFPGGIINNATVCIYNKSTNALATTINMTNPVRQIVQPDLPPGCNVPIINQVLCSNLNRFTQNVNLPGPFNQYFAVHQNCCREGDIDNLQNPGSTGNAFITEMAPNFVENSSPQFQDVVIPFLCTNDTVTLSNNAFDPDGDFLVYNFVQPVDQTGGNNCSGSYNLNNVPSVPYANNYSLTEPFGPGSVAFINASNGLTKYYAPNAGKFSITVQIQEYRDINGDNIQDLIGVIYREIIFIAQPCAPNNVPTLSPISVNGVNIPIIGGTADIDINEGELLTFNFNSSDSNNDSIYIEPVGDIIDGTNGYSGPLATFPDAAGQGSASSTFTWQNACGITGPFLVRVNVRDNGCPPKSNIFFFNINVRPYKAADELFISNQGQSVDTICFDNISRNYFVNPNNSSTLQWNANGGVINGSSNQANVDVTWTTPGLNTLTLIETSSLACSDTSVFDIFVRTPDTIQVTANLTLCEGDSIQLTAVGTTSYRWLPNISIDNNLISNPVVFPNDSIIYIVDNPTINGCALADTVKISVVKNFAAAGTNAFLCSGDTNQLGTNPGIGKVYTWDSQLNISDSTISNPVYIAANTSTNPIFDTLVLSVIDTITGCQFINTVAIVVNPLPLANAGVDDTLCSNESTNIGTSSIPGTICNWTGNFISNSNACNPIVTPQNFGSTNITYQYFLEVTNFNTTCSNMDTVEIFVKPLPPAFAGVDTTVCLFQTIDLGGSSSPGLVYSWVSSAGSSPISPTNSSSPQQFMNNVGTFQSIVTVINTDPTNLCTNRDTVQVIVRNLPNVQVITDTSICSKDSINIGGNNVNNFSYIWNTQNNISDSTIANPILSINNPTQSPQVFTYQLVVQNNNTLCIDSADFDVTVRPLPIVDAGSNVVICSESSDTLGTAALAGYNYAWTPSANLDDSLKARPEISLITGSNPDSVNLFLLVELNGCFDSDTVLVTVNPKPVVDSIFGGISICPNLEDVLYTILDTVGFINYQWGVVGGIIISPTNNDSILVDWGGLNPNASIYMIPTNIYNCVGDTARVGIDINPIISSPPPVGPNSICLSDANTVIYAVPYTSGYVYSWLNPGINHNLSPINPGNLVAFDFLEPGIAKIVVSQTATTPTSTCFGLSDTLEVTIHPNPDPTIPIIGDTSICEFTNGVPYSISGFPNSTYQWSVFPGGTLPDTSDNVIVNWADAGNYQLVAFETTEFGCTTSDIFLDIQINPIPETEFASIDTFVCAETVTGNQFTTAGFANSKYVWSLVGGSFEQNDSSETAIVTWDPFQGNLEVSVFEISEFNCVGDSISFTPTIDLSLPLVSNVTLTDPADTFSNVLLNYNKGFEFRELVPDTLTIYRKRATDATWTPIAKVSANDSSYLDNEALNRLTNYYEYQVSSVNLCSNEIFSPLHNTILLNGEGIEDFDQLNLTWNEYVNWENGVSEYEIFRRLDDQENFELFQTTGSVDYTDFSANDGFKHFFRVRAIENATGNESWSNEFEVIFLNIAQVSNVITPNGDGKNDSWKIDNIELYPGTQVKIFNRFGNEVFKSDDYQGDWQAENLPSGTYFFQAIFKHLEEPVGGYIQVLK